METDLLWGVFLASLAAGALLDLLRPLRPMAAPRWFRWLNNALLYLLNGQVSRLIIPGGAFAVAQWAEATQSGLMHHAELPTWLAILLGILLLDLNTYALHRASHRFPLLWRLHRVHHTDIDVDVTTDFRHHPFEALIVLGAATLVVIVAGVTPAAVLSYYAMVIPVSLLSHGNWRLPAGVDWWGRLLVVTPGMHRIHHSAWQPETDSNYGVLFSFWDRLFRSYREAPRDGYERMTLGLARFRDEEAQILHRLLLNPLD